ncbi:hypothetical protein [Streptomyces exfoliatus]|uniref:hypothetical protein n=1 Tax=Streptomyces exfoliatus TaxID=1905 RepID=UPI003C2C6D2D
MVGITGPGSGLDEAVERERAGAAGALREFLDSLDTAGRREAALALHRRVCRRSDEELARPALAVLARQELGWSVAESDLLLARLLGRDAEVAPHELEESFLALVPIVVSAADQAGDFDRPAIRVLRAMAASPRVPSQDLSGPLRDRMDVLLDREVAVIPGLLSRQLLDGRDDYGPAMRAAHGDLVAAPGLRRSWRTAPCSTGPAPPGGGGRSRPRGSRRPRPGRRWCGGCCRGSPHSPRTG